MSNPELHRQLVALGVDMNIRALGRDDLEIWASRGEAVLAWIRFKVKVPLPPARVDAACDSIAELAWCALMAEAQGCVA